jgi:hypothetical protein
MSSEDDDDSSTSSSDDDSVDLADSQGFAEAELSRNSGKI